MCWLTGFILILISPQLNISSYTVRSQNILGYLRIYSHVMMSVSPHFHPSMIETLVISEFH